MVSPEPRRNACMSASTRWHRQSSGPAVNPAQSFPLLALVTRASVMEVQPDIQQRSGLDQASSLEPARLAFRTPDVCGLQLIQRSEPKVGQHCPR
jgi:hypothetical protein